MVNLEDIKLPPHSIEAERWVIGSVLIDNEVIQLLEGYKVFPEDFYQKNHQLVYQSIQELWDSNKNVDVVTLSDQLNKNQVLEDVWGIDYLYDLSTAVITSTQVSDYAKILKEKSILRSILQVSQQIAWDVYQELDVDDILDKIEKKIFNLTQTGTSDSLRHIKDILEERQEMYSELVNDPSKVDEWKVMSKYSHLDNLLWGFKPWELMILAARPSMWKTSFVLNLLANAAIKQDKSVALFSLEMWKEQIVDRIMSCISEIPMYKIAKWLLDEEDFANIGDFASRITDTHIYLDDKGWASIPEIKSKLRKLKIEKWQLDFVIIDYLQLMTSVHSKFAGNRVQEIWEISRWLKQLARELEVPIMALSQLSRAVEQRPDKKPQLSDLRESWSIEQDADAVLMLYREDYYDHETDRKGLADVFVRKNRNWPTGDVELVFKDEIMKFYEKAEEEEYPEF